MTRQRTVAAAPIRSAREAWCEVTGLLASTLERSPAVPDGSVAQELEPLRGLGPALIAGGHLESDGLVLVDDGLYLKVLVVTADAATKASENLNPVPGGASATSRWMLYLPRGGPLASCVADAVKTSGHLSADPPPKPEPDHKAAGHARESLIDLEALRRMGAR